MTRAGVRAAARLWLLPVLAVLVVVAVLAGSGGLRSGQGAPGRRAAAGEVLELARWQLVVHGVELAPDRYVPRAPPEVVVHAQVTSTAPRSTYGLGPGLVTVSGPAGPLGVEDTPSVESGRTGGFDPDVPQEVTLHFTWPAAPASGPPVLRVLVHDEQLRENYLTSSDWRVRPTAVAHLDLPCPDRR